MPTAPPYSQRNSWLIAGALAMAALLAYAPGLAGSFVFDDIPSIPENPSLRAVWPLHGPLTPPGEGLTVSGRPVLNLSFALNVACGATPRGFRLTNLAIHFGGALLLFGFVRRTLLSAPLQGRFGAEAGSLASAIAGLWLLHPLQTASVTYIVQRAESLMGFFFLLTLYAMVRSAASVRAPAWYAVACVACLLGMGTKEVMVSAPPLMLLYDRLFLTGSWGEVWRRRRGIHLALAATWLLLAGLLLQTGARGGGEGFSLGVSAGAYWLTQFRAVVKYLALVVWPYPLILDYGVEWVRGVGDFAPPAAVVLALLAATVAALRRARPVAFAGAWLFLVLAPTSLMPGGRQTMAEHRMYLPLAAVVAVAVLACHERLGRRAWWGWIAVVVAMGVMTGRRNADYRSTLAIWADTVAKKPDNRWARDNFGNSLLAAGHAAEALRQYEAALALHPSDPVHHHNAGNACAALGRWSQAIAHYQFATRATPERAQAHATLGDALARAGRKHEAIGEFAAAVRLEPRNTKSAYALGCMLLETGQPQEAAREFQRVLTIDPAHAEAAANLGSALARLGRLDEALRRLREAVRLNPANPEPHHNLGVILLHLGQFDAAAAALAEALRLAPDHAAARESLARLREMSRPR